jgi:TatD DNase family protein
MKNLPTLDAHAHLDPARTKKELAESGAVLAMTFSLEQAAVAIERNDGRIAWGAGCHPRNARAQEAFDIHQFCNLVKHTTIVGEVGLDAGSAVPLAEQRRVFRQILEVVADHPRLVSIHSTRATAALVLEELQRRRVSVPVIHGRWMGTAAETRDALELGCYFSIHSQVARYSIYRNMIPPERVLVETDHGAGDPPAAIPCRIEWVEYLVAQQYDLDVKNIRRLVWQNFGTIIHRTGTAGLLPRAMAGMAAGDPEGR